ncbi:DUF4920 domain-containing protein [Roseivirga sp. BDSF3-8]|uniref:DUF4920 domain-containing protein n=1 Tax=Roseivirga sp. BDSF3-8 TaxID=3241598 RepID=UPI0035323CF8
MKRIGLLSLLIVGLACSENKQSQESAEVPAPEASVMAYYGDTIETTKAVSAMALEEELGREIEKHTRVKGTVTDVCQAKGCWMKVDLGDGETMRVTFKDYGFFVPKDAAGQTVVIEGVAQKEVIDVETQRHYAADAGKSAEEIEQITEPRAELTFEAEGVAFLREE